LAVIEGDSISVPSEPTKMNEMTIKVCHEDFDVSDELQRLNQANKKVGAIASFIGLVRDFGDATDVEAMELEHYPGMTENALRGIAEEACRRWDIAGVTVIHRVGRLKPADQIVLVCCASAHRRAAFSACEFIADYLKVRAPFWKKEITAKGAQWVAAKTSDEADLQRWKS